MNDVPFHERSVGRRVRRPRTRSHGVARRGFANSLLALSPARRYARDSVESWRLTEDEQTTVVLVVSELVSNAVRHARTASRVTLRRSRQVIHVLVRDFSPRAPRAGEGTPACHGLEVVDAASSRWGWHRHGRGKTVWATITVASPYKLA